MIALGMNGEALPLEHGFPARLVVPGLYGYVSATKWLRKIELTTWDAEEGFWVPRGWARDAPIKTQSRIDVPRDEQAHTGRPDEDRRDRLGATSRRRRRSRCASTTARGKRHGWATTSPTMHGDNGSSTGRRRRATTPFRSAPPTRPARPRPPTQAPPDPDGATGYHTRNVRSGC